MFGRNDPSASLSSRQRVKFALDHKEPDRVPVDFLATPEIWQRLVSEFQVHTSHGELNPYLDASWEAVLHHLEVDCRVVSYDQFCQPPESRLYPGAVVDWFGSLGRSTPSRMWRQRLPNGDLYDIWGHHYKVIQHPFGAYEEIGSYPLSNVDNFSELKVFSWPEPDFWDFEPLPDVLKDLDSKGELHIRFRIGSVFECAWQLRGLQEFMRDLAVNPEIPVYILERLTDVHVENLKRVLALVGDRMDMVYFYDDVASQRSLLISKDMWRNYLRPSHARLVEAAHLAGIPVMYHCDGAVYGLIPELIDLGIDVLNPIQPDAKDMQPEKLKTEFGAHLTFHGGVDIKHTLPHGNPQEVKQEVQKLVRILGENGGYILCSAHHIQPDTQIENIRTMYSLETRYRN